MLQERGGADEELLELDRAGLRIREDVVAVVPGLLGLGVVQAPLDRRGVHGFGGVGQSVDEAGTLGLGGAQGLARGDVLQRRLHADHARQALGAAGTREDADHALGQADLDTEAVQGDPVVAAQCELVAPAQGGAGERRDDREGQGLDLPVEPGQVEHAGQHLGRVVRQVEHVDVGADTEVPVARADHQPLDAVLGLGPLDRREQPLAEVGVELVDLAVHLHEQRGDAGVGVEGDRAQLRLESHVHTRSMMVAMPMPPPMQRVTRPVERPRSSSSSSTVLSSMAPVAPRG